MRGRDTDSKSKVYAGLTVVHRMLTAEVKVNICVLVEKKTFIRVLLAYMGIWNRCVCIVAGVGMWVTPRYTEPGEKGWVRLLGKGWQAVGKMLYLFRGLSMLYQRLIHAFSRQSAAVIHHIHA